MERLRLAGFVRRPTADGIRRLAATQLVGKHFNESLLFRVGQPFERSHG